MLDELQSLALSYYNCLDEKSRLVKHQQLDFFFNKAQKKLDALLEQQKSEYFKDIRSQKKDSPKAIEYINLMKDIALLKENMGIFYEQVAYSHHLADVYKNDFFKLENLFTILI